MKIQITYANGVVQIKEVIPHNTFLTVIKPSKERLHQLESELSNKQAKYTEVERNAKKDEIKGLKEVLNPFTNPLCTDQSPIFEAMATGVLVLPENQGGSRLVIIKEISN